MRSDADEQINFGRLILKTMEMEKLDTPLMKPLDAGRSGNEIK
jgi:hypothetical protein